MKSLNSLPLLIVIILGGTSFYLAQKEEYEASMGALGTAAAIATARNDSGSNSSQRRALERIRELQTGLIQANESLKYQDIVKQIEIENAKLQVENRLLSAQQKANLPSGPQLESLRLEAQENQSDRTSAKLRDEKNA